MEERSGGRWGLAFLLACPACAGGVLIAVAAAAGVTALVLKGAAATALVVLVGGLWIRNAWRRRNESCRPDAP